MFEWRDHRRWLEGWENAQVAETEIIEIGHPGLFESDSIVSGRCGPTPKRPGGSRALARERANSQVYAETSSRSCDIFLPSVPHGLVLTNPPKEWTVILDELALYVGNGRIRRLSSVGCIDIPTTYLPAMTDSSSSSRASSARSGRVNRGSRNGGPRPQ